MVLRTKINGKHINTTLVDEGATDSVLNIDWYEHKGIDWRKEFGIDPDITLVLFTWLTKVLPLLMEQLELRSLS
jgi:hypothetical protein